MPVHCMIALFQWRNRVVAEELSVPIWGQGFFFPQKCAEVRESSAESPDFRGSAIPAKKKGGVCMKIYKKLMNAVAAIEKFILVVTMLLILVLTVGNVFSRYVIHRSWSFTEELVVAVFVLITLLATALGCREGELVNLTLVTDHLPAKAKNRYL